MSSMTSRPINVLGAVARLLEERRLRLESMTPDERAKEEMRAARIAAEILEPTSTGNELKDEKKW